jgi:hypothetical protein
LSGPLPRKKMILLWILATATLVLPSPIFSCLKGLVSCLLETLHLVLLAKYQKTLPWSGCSFLLCLTWLSWHHLLLLAPCAFLCSGWQDWVGVFWRQRSWVLLMTTPEGSRRTTAGDPIP